MNETDWKSIPAKLYEAGFAVAYARISYSPENPLWRATALRDAMQWNGEGRNLEEALLVLDGQMREGATAAASGAF